MTRANKTQVDGKATEKPTRAAVELVNPGTAGLVYDEAGHGVGGGQRVTLDGDPDAVAMRQLELGNLLAQRGDTWLTVRDGKLVDPDAGAEPAVDSATPPHERRGNITALDRENDE